MFPKLIALFKIMRYFHELVVMIPFIALYFIVYSQSKTPESFHASHAIPSMLMCFSVQLYLAAGCIFNDIMDLEIDRVNKPNTRILERVFSLRTAWYIIFVLLLLQVATSFVLSKFFLWQWAIISPLVFFFSILYDVKLKRSPLFGNFQMALMTAFIPLCFQLYFTTELQEIGNPKVEILFHLFAWIPFAFIIPRELSLDISDMEGDAKNGCKTLPILIGISKARIIVIVLLLLYLITFAIFTWFQMWLLLSYLFSLAGIIVYFALFRKCATRIAYIKAGRWLWFVMIVTLVVASTVCFFLV